MISVIKKNINKINKNIKIEDLPSEFINKINNSQKNKNIIISEYLLLKKYILINNEKIKYNKYKKPYVKNGLYFNFSHSYEYLVLIISKENEVGIDIEKIRDVKYYKNIINKFFTEDEKEYINNDVNKFIKIWTRKESFYKCIGTGFYKYDKNISVLKNKIKYNKNTYYITTKKFNNYYISQAIKMIGE